MDHAELLSQLDYLSISHAELERITDRVDWLAGHLRGREPALHWLDLVTLYWADHPELLERARAGGAPLTADDLRDRMERFGLSVEELARLVYRPIAGVRQWLAGEAALPRWMALIMDAWTSTPGALDVAREAADALYETDKVPAN
jgi:hypothetical protein